ncbi:MAG: peptidyl-prolyl cis-trans isomerase [Candidatus Eisenbacteria bacterium]|nr:peptidyl-prolyl cis-trans isomerase [Candidatus Eisenbacteria bacterium]
MRQSGRFAAPIVLLTLLGLGCGRDSGSSSGKIKSPDGSPVLARVGDYLITAKQVETRIRESVGESSYEESIKNPDIIQVGLAALIDQIVWGKAGADAGYDKDQNLRRQVYLYETELLGQRYLEDTVNRQVEPSDEEVLEFYEKYKVNYSSPVRVSVRHIMARERSRVETAARRILMGEDFSKVARELSEDENTRELGGALGYVSAREGALGLGKDEKFLAAALSLQPGATSPVIQGAKGYHIILCEAREGGVALPMEEVRDDIVKRVQTGGKLAEVYNTALFDARAKFKAEIFQEAVDSYTGVSDSVERLWEVVEMQPNERGQIEVLRRIATDFIKHDLADDAQLRIAWLYAARLEEPRKAQKALGALKARFPNSKLLPAGAWLEAHLDDREIALVTFEDLKIKKPS